MQIQDLKFRYYLEILQDLFIDQKPNVIPGNALTAAIRQDTSLVKNIKAIPKNISKYVITAKRKKDVKLTKKYINPELPFLFILF